MVETLRKLKAILPDLGDPERMVVDKDHVEVTSTYSAVPIKFAKIDGKWRVENGNLAYGSIADAVFDAVLVQKLNSMRRKLKTLF